MKLTRYIPNFLTLLNLTSGLIALFFVFKQNWLLVGAFVLLGIIFDFFDGFAARALKVSSPLGLQLDSLADMVTSGVVPAFTLSFLIATAFDISLTENFVIDTPHLLSLLGLIIAPASAYRLAKFNIDDRQTSSFIGLPTPANALFIISLAIIINSDTYPIISSFLNHPYILIFTGLLSASMLNAEIPLFGLKFKDFSFAHNKEKYLIILLSIVLLALLQIAAVPLIIILYVFISMVRGKWKVESAKGKGESAKE